MTSWSSLQAIAKLCRTESRDLPGEPSQMPALFLAALPRLCIDSTISAYGNY